MVTIQNISKNWDPINIWCRSKVIINIFLLLEIVNSLLVNNHINICINFWGNIWGEIL